MRIWENKSGGIIPFSVPQGNPEEKLIVMMKEISKFQKGVDYSTPKSKKYKIISDELKIKLRLIVWEKSFERYSKEEHGGEFYENDWFFYGESKEDVGPDTFEIKKYLVESERDNFPQIIEIDDKKDKEIHQENLENKAKNQPKGKTEKDSMIAENNQENSQWIDRRRDEWLIKDNKSIYKNNKQLNQLRENNVTNKRNNVNFLYGSAIVLLLIVGSFIFRLKNK